MSLMNNFDLDLRERYLIEQMVSVHFYTKKYLLIAEEIAEQGELFLQPLKEHRDAFDHMMRCYGVFLVEDDSMSEEKKQEYIQKNLEKAFGHVYRAFFDTADWLTYILRKFIRIKLKDAGDEICKQNFDNYAQIKKTINEVPFKVAELRGSKDIAKLNNQSENSVIKEVKEYIDIIEELIKLRECVISVLGL